MDKPHYDAEALPPDLRALIPNYRHPAPKVYSILSGDTPVLETEQKVVTPQCQTKQVKQKSSAQVETLVRPQVVSPISCGLKPKRKRPHRLMGRFSDTEKEVVNNKAKEACLSVNEFIRASLLGDGYLSRLDPVKKELLCRISRELSKHGKHLSHIEEYLHSGKTNPYEGNSMLAMVGRSLIAAHRAVGTALVEGLDYE